MLVFKIAPIFLLALTASAEKKIELQDIEEDNLRSEKQTQYEKSEGRPQGSGGTAPGYVPLDYLKNNFIHHFEPTPLPQHRYVHQYAVTEQPERSPATPKPQYGPPTAQQPVLGYLSNVPMQLLLVPQYYNDPSQQAAQHHSGVQLPAPAVGPVPYHQESQNIQQQSGYIEVPTYVTPTGKTYLQPYTPPVSYLSYAQPTIAPTQPTVTPVLAYQMPVVQYPTAISAPPPKGYYQSPQYIESNSVDESQDNEINIQKQYPSHTEIHSTKPSGSGFPRYYNSRTPVREDYNRVPIELPSPNPLLLKGPPPHLAHIPKALPMYRPLTKPVYTTGGGFISSAFTPRPSENFPISFKGRPTPLLDSYIPSSVQIEYMKRGYTKDPLSAYEALASGRHLSQTSRSPFIPRYYERGFLPNQMYHTAAGGITYGHHKRAPRLEKSS